MNESLNQKALEAARDVLYDECGDQWDTESLGNAIKAYLIALEDASTRKDEDAAPKMSSMGTSSTNQTLNDCTDWREQELARRFLNSIEGGS